MKTKKQIQIILQGLTALFPLLLTIFTINPIKAQQSWNFTTQSGLENTAKDCPVYNANDPEINIEYQKVLGEPDANNYAYDIEFTPDSNLVYLYYSGLYQAVYLVCVSPDITELWRTQIMANDTTTFGKKINFLGSNIYVTGSWDIGNNRYFGVTKLDKEGNQLWFKKLFEAENSEKKIREFNPYLLNVEDSNFLGSFIESGDLTVAKFDSSFNIKWKKSFKEFVAFDNIYAFNITYKNSNYYVFASELDSCNTFIYDLIGNLKSRLKLSGSHYNSNLIKGNFYFTGVNYNTKQDYIRKYSPEFSLLLEYKPYDPADQKIIYDAADINLFSDQSISVFYDFEYYGSNYEVESNFQVLHISKVGECISTLNLYAPGSQNSKKMLVDNSNNVLLFGHGYNQYYDNNMLALIKIKQWDPVSIINEKPSVKLATVFPNPFVNTLSITFNKNYTGNIKLFNVQGELQINKRVNNKNTIQLNTAKLNKGVYFLQLSNRSNTQSFKILKN